MWLIHGDCTPAARNPHAWLHFYSLSLSVQQAGPCFCPCPAPHCPKTLCLLSASQHGSEAPVFGVDCTQQPIHHGLKFSGSTTGQ